MDRVPVTGRPDDIIAGVCMLVYAVTSPVVAMTGINEQRIDRYWVLFFYFIFI